MYSADDGDSSTRPLMPSSRCARFSPWYASWLKPRSFSWPMSVTSPTLSVEPAFADVVACWAAVVSPPLPLPPQAATVRARTAAAVAAMNLLTIPPGSFRLTVVNLVKKLTNPFQTVLSVVLQVRDDDLQVLLWRRAQPPFEGAWALPGGRLEPGETLEQSIRRHLAAKVDVRELAHLEQLETRSDPRRNPAAWELATGYLGLVPAGV